MEKMFQVHPFHSERGCLSYLIVDTATQEAVLIDPSQEMEQEYDAYFEAHPRITLRYLLETHTHADHVSLSRMLREKTDARIAMSALSPSPSKDLPLKDGDTLSIGRTEIEVWHTPGHTNESLSYKVGDALFTGDMLLIGGTGRTDFQLGESERLYESLRRVAALPVETVIYPAHNYQGIVSSTIDAEKKNNERFRLAVERRKEDFIALLDQHKPPTPELFEVSLEENTK